VARSLGISLQPDGFSFVLLEGSTRRYTVKAAGSGGLDPEARDPLKALGKTLSRALKTGAKGSRRDQVVVTVPSVDTVLRELSLPFSDRDKVHSVLKFEVESDLYHYDIDEVVCDFLELQDERATSTILVAALPKKDIATALDLAEAGGFDPPVLDLDLGALAAALPELAPAGGESGPESDELEGFFYVGPYSSLLIVRGPEGLRAVRAMRSGWRELGRGLEDAGEEELRGAESEPGAEASAPGDEASAPAAEEPLLAGPAGDSGGDDEEGDEEDQEGGSERLFRADPGLPVGLGLDTVLENAPPAARTALVRRLVGEVRRGLAAVASAPVQQLHLLGAGLPGLEEALQTRLGIPAAALPAPGTAPDGSAPDPIALGAALRGLGALGPRMNFRQEEYRFTRGFERVEGAFTVMLLGLIAWLMVDSVILYKKSRPLKTDADRIFVRAKARVDKLNQIVRDKNYPPDWTVKTAFEGLEVDPLRRINLLEGRVKSQKLKLDEMLGKTGAEMPQSCLEAWRLLMDVLSKEFDGYPDRWMLESLSFESIPGSTRLGAHVKASFGVSVFSDDPIQARSKLDHIVRTLDQEEWTIGNAQKPAVVTPGGFTGADTHGAQFGKIEVQISVDKAQELGL